MNVEIGADATEDDDGRGAPRSGQRGEQLDDLAANEIGCGRIQLQRASARQKIALNGPGIRRMSVQCCRGRHRIADFKFA